MDPIIVIVIGPNNVPITMTIIGPNYSILFHSMGIGGDWLELFINEWENDPNYQEGSVGKGCETNPKLRSSFLLQVVDYHRKLPFLPYYYNYIFSSFVSFYIHTVYSSLQIKIANTFQSVQMLHAAL